MKLSIILPARNEEELIENSVRDIYKYLKKKSYSFEILVIVNGSSDKTIKIARTLSKSISQLKILMSKAGYGFALRKGLGEAKGEYLAIFNIDFYDLQLLDFIESNLVGRDLIIGSKTTFWSEDKRPFPRRVLTRLLNLYLKVLYGFRGSDTHGIKIMKRKIVKAVLSECKTSSGIFDTEFIIRTQRKGFKIADFPVIVEEKRCPRFKKRFFQTPIDIWELHKNLIKNIRS